MSERRIVMEKFASEIACIREDMETLKERLSNLQAEAMKEVEKKDVKNPTVCAFCKKAVIDPNDSSTFEEWGEDQDVLLCLDCKEYEEAVCTRCYQKDKSVRVMDLKVYVDYKIHATLEIKACSPEQMPPEEGDFKTTHDVNECDNSNREYKFECPKCEYSYDLSGSGQLPGVFNTAEEEIVDDVESKLMQT
jgi:hypothetical protein